jgi:hypothetical protein
MDHNRRASGDGREVATLLSLPLPLSPYSRYISRVCIFSPLRINLSWSFNLREDHSSSEPEDDSEPPFPHVATLLASSSPDHLGSTPAKRQVEFTQPHLGRITTGKRKRGDAVASRGTSGSPPREGPRQQQDEVSITGPRRGGRGEASQGFRNTMSEPMIRSPVSAGRGAALVKPKARPPRVPPPSNSRPPARSSRSSSSSSVMKPVAHSPSIARDVPSPAPTVTRGGRTEAFAFRRDSSLQGALARFLGASNKLKVS